MSAKHNTPSTAPLSGSTLGDSPRIAAGKIAQWIHKCLQGDAGTMHWHSQGNRHMLEFSTAENQQCEIYLEEHAGAQFNCLDGIADDHEQVLLLHVGSSADAVMFISSLAEKLRMPHRHPGICLRAPSPSLYQWDTLPRDIRCLVGRPSNLCCRVHQ